jgi:cation diffusion facilitator CzcD-associated flavoprotein CzcO
MRRTEHTEPTYCIVGAGAAGLAAARNFKRFDIPFEVIEREDDVGGNWAFGKSCSSVYGSTHLISSKRFSEYTDFPIPDSLPTYLSHAQAWDYLRSYARAFDLYSHIIFNRSVQKAEPLGDSWQVTFDDGSTRLYRGLVVANGHLWDARWPEYPGHFDGPVLHSSQYKTPDVLRGKRVLVVGAGNSGCDIAVEASQNAARTFHSTRRGYYFWPKFMFGMPADEFYEAILKMRLPLPIRRFFGRLVLRMFLAVDPARVGLPRPDHHLFESHFVINSTLLYHLGHGDIAPKPDIQELCGDSVVFADGTREHIDVIVYATGFNLVNIPFLDPSVYKDEQGRHIFYLNIFHPRYDNLFAVGLFQTSTGNWPLMDYQSQVVASYVSGLERTPERVKRLRQLKAAGRFDVSGGINYMSTSRHDLEVEHFAYRQVLKELIAQLAGSPPTHRLSHSAQQSVLVGRYQAGG